MAVEMRVEKVVREGYGGSQQGSPDNGEWHEKTDSCSGHGHRWWW
jgi:hypothetical protein